MFKKILEDIVSESMTISSVVGNSANVSQFSSDFYAPNDARIPSFIGAKKVKPFKKSSKKKNKPLIVKRKFVKESLGIYGNSTIQSISKVIENK